MLYKNYKQVAIIHLSTADADSVITSGNVNIQALPVQVNTEYAFNINIPHKFTKRTKLALVDFEIYYKPPTGWIDYNNKTPTVGGLYIKDLHKSNIYYKNKSKGLLLLNGYFGGDVKYNNPDIINNSIDITNNTSFLEGGNTLKIFLDTNIIADNDVMMDGCLSIAEWFVKLIIFEEEAEENKPDFVDNKVVNYSRPTIY